jgi:hypothetical protein
MKRKLPRMGVILSFLLLLTAAAFVLWPRDRITKASFLKIQASTTEKEVESVLGSGGLQFKEVKGRYEALAKQADVIWYAQERPTDNPKPLKGIQRYWLGRAGIISIEIDPNTGIVYSQQFMTRRSLECTFLDRLRDWFGW